MIRNASGQYSSVHDEDEWRFGSKESQSSVMRFKPQLIIVPGRMVRIQALGPKDCGAETRIDLAMGVPWEFLTSETWFCTNCCKNELFQKMLKEVRTLPVLSNMVIVGKRDRRARCPKLLEPKWAADGCISTLCCHINLVHSHLWILAFCQGLPGLLKTRGALTYKTSGEEGCAQVLESD